MALAKILFFVFLYHLLQTVDSKKCPKSFDCGRLGKLEFPLSNDTNCGLLLIKDCDSISPTLHFTQGAEEYWYNFLGNKSANQFLLSDPYLQKELTEEKCISFKNISLPLQSPLISFTLITPRNLTLFKCPNLTPTEVDHSNFQKYKWGDCLSGDDPYNPDSTLYYLNPDTDESSIPSSYSVIQLPLKSTGGLEDLSDEFILEWSLSKDCYECYHGGGQCFSDNMNKFHCKKGESKLKLILGVSGGGLLLVICLLAAYIVWLRNKRINGSYPLSRNMSSNLAPKSDIEGGGFYFGTPIFSYVELEKATNNFDPSKELGDGGFGTVYYGKLGDGREVAIKRLYEHNFRRVEQFLNEIKILTCLRHPNLVSLYGCTSRRSHELLLVYEYISNGTVADHLHGERAKEALLTWPVRLSIAIETATALAYLHNSEVIHRDIKTNNILLDNNFCVKVADFGLSRLFPNDVTHISTAPQGTPGYVDPEYHQCYQLTDRSDVYSFGVVLIELISSMPAVDISRHRHEVNLANLAVDRIQRCAFDELIDPSLGYDSDPEVTRMTVSVAELAFCCLQLEKDLRPCMDDVVGVLKSIQCGDDCDFEQIKGANGSHTAPGRIRPSPETEDAVLVKNKNIKSSPTAVTDRWASSGSTTASSIR